MVSRLVRLEEYEEGADGGEDGEREAVMFSDGLRILRLYSRAF